MTMDLNFPHRKLQDSLEHTISPISLVAPISPEVMGKLKRRYRQSRNWSETVMILILLCSATDPYHWHGATFHQQSYSWEEKYKQICHNLRSSFIPSGQTMNTSEIKIMNLKRSRKAILINAIELSHWSHCQRTQRFGPKLTQKQLQVR